MQTLPVIFRRDRRKRDAQITAVFPTLPANRDGNMTCYAHIGQHGACSLAWYHDKTRPAAPDEYAPLLAELRQIYEEGAEPVRLEVCAYRRPDHIAAFRQSLREIQS